MPRRSRGASKKQTNQGQLKQGKHRTTSGCKKLHSTIAPRTMPERRRCALASSVKTENVCIQSERKIEPCEAMDFLRCNIRASNYACRLFLLFIFSTVTMPPSMFHRSLQILSTNSVLGSIMTMPPLKLVSAFARASTVSTSR